MGLDPGRPFHVPGAADGGLDASPGDGAAVVEAAWNFSCHSAARFWATLKRLPSVL